MSMTDLHPKPHWWHNIIKRAAATKFGTWLVANTLHHLDRPFIKLTNGHNSPSRFLAGLPVVTLTAIGAKSGKPRSIPLAGYPFGEKVILIATNFGRNRHPGWYHNLKANPEVVLSFLGHTKTYVSHEAEGEEYQTYWQQAVALYAGYEVYKQRAGKRHIPVVVLTPKQ
ncbi:MAG: nitroreductase family deazaflavin-dependent oxidoreductase [Anaerolineales bacterium]|nr:MAG: nitroreductase family deazaflavin-dependent oxidoreductase [Anaerolineales bacterium]